jgi:hypothetical protein
VHSYWKKGKRCRPTNRAPKRPQNSLIFWKIPRDTGILVVFWHLWALRTRPGEAADLSIMAHRGRGWLNLPLYIFQLLPTAHHAKQAPQILCTDSPRPKQHSHGDSSVGKRRMRGQFPRKGKIPRYYGRRQYIDNPHRRRNCLARGNMGSGNMGVVEGQSRI